MRAVTDRHGVGAQEASASRISDRSREVRAAAASLPPRVPTMPRTLAVRLFVSPMISVILQLLPLILPRAARPARLSWLRGASCRAAVAMASNRR